MNIWPWSQFNKLQHEINALERENKELREFKENALIQFGQVKGQLDEEVKKNMQHQNHFRKVATTLALRGLDKIAIILALLCLVLPCAGQTVLRICLDTNFVATAPANGWVLVWSNNVPIWALQIGNPTNAFNFIGSSNYFASLIVAAGGITGNITGAVYLATDTAAHIDATTPGLALANWAYDANRFTMGDGSTAGGVVAGLRYWKTPTNSLIAGGRYGEIAVTKQGYNNLNASPANSLHTIVWVNAKDGTNWLPFLTISTNSIGTNRISEFTADTAFIYVDSGTNGAFFDAAALAAGFGMPGVIDGAVRLIAGSAGNAFDALDDSAGGNGGTLQSAFTIQTGRGGNATAIGGIGGNGGTVINAFVIRSGDGGNDAFGNGGGLGGGAGGFNFIGGKGGDGTGLSIGAVGGAGGNIQSLGGNGSGANAGGAGGTININGGSATSTTAGGVGGGLNVAASGIFAGGTFTGASSSSRNGGNVTSFGSSYVPMTLFTTTTTAGPSASSSEVSLLGTAAFLASPSSLTVSGKVIGSNVVDHAGRTLRFKLSGYIATSLTPTLEIKLKLGSTTVIDTSAQTLIAITGNNTWTFSGELSFRTTGSMGTCIGQGVFEYFSAATTLNGFSTANTGTTTIDTTKDEAIDCTGQFSANNTLQCTSAIFELVD